MRILSKEEANCIDQLGPVKFCIPLGFLMENAGRGVADQIITSIDEGRLPDKTCVCVCGIGNNGADGIVAARHLLEQGVSVILYIVGDYAKGSNLFGFQYKIARSMDIPMVESLKDIDWHDVGCVVEGLVGTGMTGEFRDSLRDLLKEIGYWLEQYKEIQLWAIDIPAGVNTDTGSAATGTLWYDRTITFGSVKMGHCLYPGREICGEINVTSLGLPWQVLLKEIGTYTIESFLEAHPLPKRGVANHKGRNGHAVIIGGSQGMLGAPIMAGEAAVYAGTGKTTIYTVDECLSAIQMRAIPEIMTKKSIAWGTEIAVDEMCRFIIDKEAVAIGPGMGRSEAVKRQVESALRWYEGTLVLDADGLFSLGNVESSFPFSKREHPCILTPHLGEFSELTGQSISYIKEHYIEVAREFAKTHGVILVLKGVPSIIADPLGYVFVNRFGNSGMGIGGMGDVLTGMITSLAAQGLDALEAAVWGVYLHSLAADRLYKERTRGYTPSDVSRQVSYVLGELETV